MYSKRQSSAKRSTINCESIVEIIMQLASQLFLTLQWQVLSFQ